MAAGALVAGVLSALWLAACCAAAAQETEPASPPPKPPLLKPARWQQLDACYKDLFIDGSGRAWYYTFRNWYPHPQWAYLACPEFPDKPIQMPGANVPLGFDGRNRFWDIGKFGLCCTDVQRDTFFQRRPVKGLPDVPPYPGAKPGLPFAPTMFEHSSGRLYFFDAEGRDILDGDTWSYHKFTPPLPVVRNGFPLLRLVEGPRGEVYVWTENCGGLQVHNGMAWKSYAAWDHPALGKIDDVLPQPDGTIRVFDGSGEEATVALSALRPLPPPAVVLDRDGLRDARNQRSRHVWWTKTPLADFIGEELAAYGMFLAKDGQGRVYFSTGPAGPGPGPGFSWIAVFDPRYPEDVPTLKYECVRLGGGHRAIRLDSQQRLWARLSEKDQPFLSRYDGDGWTHFADPTPATAAPSANRGASKPPRQFGPMTLSAAMPDARQRAGKAAARAGFGRPQLLPDASPRSDGSVVLREPDVPFRRSTVERLRLASRPRQRRVRMAQGTHR